VQRELLIHSCNVSMEGIVMKSTGSWYLVRNNEGELFRSRLRGKFKISGLKVTNPLAVGDKVVFEVEDAGDGSAAITEILPRDNYIVRQSVHKTAHGHIIAANIDQAILVATLVFPKTSLGFIDRFLVSAESFRIPATLVFNKADLLDEEDTDYLNQVCRMYEQVGYNTLVTSVATGQGIDEFQALLKGKKNLLSGHSGVGKSSLVNTIAPDLRLKTTEVSTFANKGVHTTTFAEMFELEEGTYLIDTPGIKELGIMDIEDNELSHYFPEMRDMLNQCRFHNCSHRQEPGCAVREAVEKGRLSLTRYNSYLSILESYDNRR
jgi:ribosome biogenesis GTPase / thiamine phosphate phosphatase